MHVLLCREIDHHGQEVPYAAPIIQGEASPTGVDVSPHLQDPRVPVYQYSHAGR